MKKSIAAMMMALLVMSAVPAFAAGTGEDAGRSQYQRSDLQGDYCHGRNGDGYCYGRNDDRYCYDRENPGRR